MSQLHHHEILASFQPLNIVKKVHQVEVTFTNGLTTLAAAHGKTLDSTKCGMLYGGWRANNTTNYSQLHAKYTLDNTNINLSKVNAAAADVYHCMSIIEFQPWACIGKKSVTHAISGTGSSSHVTLDPLLGQRGFYIPFWSGHDCGATNQNQENSSPKVSFIHQDGFDDIHIGFDALATLTNGANVNMDYLFFGGEQLDYDYPRSPFVVDSAEYWAGSPSIGSLAGASLSAVRNMDFQGAGTSFKKDWTQNFPLGISNKDFQSAQMYMLMTGDDQYTVARENAASSTSSAAVFPVLWNPRIIRHVQRGIGRIDDAANTANIPLVGFTDFNKMAVSHHGVNTNNLFANLYAWATTKLTAVDNLRLQRELTGFSIHTDVAYEVVEYW